MISVYYKNEVSFLVRVEIGLRLGGLVHHALPKDHPYVVEVSTFDGQDWQTGVTTTPSLLIARRRAIDILQYIIDYEKNIEGVNQAAQEIRTTLETEEVSEWN